MKYAFTHANVLDGTKDMEVQEDMTVFVDGDRIVAIEKSSSDPTSITGYFERDLKGSFLMPGLINMHAHHFGYGKPAKNLSGGKSQERLLAFTHTKLGHAYLDSVAAANVKNELMSGVTTLRGVGDLEWADVRTRDKINAEKIPGPRFLVSGPAMTVKNGHGAGTFARIAQTPEEFRALVKDCVAHHVDFIKICVTGGVMDSLEPDQCGLLRMNAEQTAAVCDEAAKAGMYVASHTESVEGVAVAIGAGVKTIEHGSSLNPDTIALYKKFGSSNTCTISVAQPLAELPCEKTMMPDVVKYNAGVVMQRIIDGTKDCLANDIPVGLGTDSGCPYITSYDMWRELYDFVKYAEVTNRWALHTATQINARLIGLGDLTGTIERGKCADLIVVDQNPLDDITALRNVRLVMARGRLFDHPTVKRIPEIDATLDTLM